MLCLRLRAAGRLGRKDSSRLRLARPVSGAVPAPSLFLSVSPGIAQDEPMSHSFTRHSPDSMLRPPSRFTDSSAPAETLPAASGRCRRRIRASDVAQAPESCGHAGSRLFLRIGHNVRCAETFLHRFHSLFVMPFRTAFPSFPIYLSIRPIAEWRERDAVLFHFGRFGSHCRSSFRLLSDTGGFFCPSYTTPACTSDGQKSLPVFFRFRSAGSRDVLPGRYFGDSAALIGFCEGGRAGNPMPQLSPCINILRSDRYDGIARGYIQFKDRPSDRRHAYF